MRPPRDYDPVAFLYDFVADVGSFGSIRASKRYQTTRLRRGDRVLFAGSGTGEDAVAAARLGCEVTCVDASARMLAVPRRARDGRQPRSSACAPTSAPTRRWRRSTRSAPTIC